MRSGSSFGAAIDFVNGDNNWIGLNNPTKDNAALDAHWGAESTYDYFNTAHCRSSYDNASSVIQGYVHTNLVGFGYTNNDNAYWDSSLRVMVYGDGTRVFSPLTALDVVAHELGHGYAQYMVGFDRTRPEANALNEGLSDIWGTCVEYSVAPNKQTWKIGEDITQTASCLRNLASPNSGIDPSTSRTGGYPDVYNGQYYDSSTGEPHTNSTILGHWFYLLAAGGIGSNSSGTAYNITGVGIGKASDIVFRAENNGYITSTASYQTARSAMIQAATELYGPCSPEEIATINAWYAVGVGPNPPITPPITGPNTVCTSPTPFQVNASNVAWTASPASLFTVASGSGSQFSTQAQPGAAGRGIITATVCGGITASIPVTVGSPGPDAINGYTDTGLWRIKATATAVLGATSYNWYVNDVLQTSSHTPSITVPIAHECDRSYSVQVEVINRCGVSERTSQNFDASCPQNYALSVYPNPAANQLTVESTDSTGQVIPTTFEATLFDKYSRVKKVQGTTKGRVEILTRDLPAGIYFLEVKQGGTVQRKQISIQP